MMRRAKILDSEAYRDGGITIRIAKSTSMDEQINSYKF